MIYCYLCPECDRKEEVNRSMSDCENTWRCSICDEDMVRDYQAEGTRVSKGTKRYRHQIVSDSLAMNPNQIAEHRKLFPDIQMTKEGQPVFDNYTDHEKYLNTCNIEKVAGKKKKKGKRIA